MIGECIRMIWNEARNCTYEEKQYIASVYWNRLNSKLKFNKPKADFLGLQKNVVIQTNDIDELAFEECVSAALMTQTEKIRKEIGTNDFIFFNLSGEMKNKYYKLEKFKKNNFKHTFYKAVTK